MAAPNEKNSGETKGKPRAKKSLIKIDMTPMVDLAFLLLTFFILTTTLAEQKTLDIILPADGDPKPINNGLTIILSGNNKIYYYNGELKKETRLVQSDFSNIRQVIKEKNQVVRNKLKVYEAKHPGIDFENDPAAKEVKKKIQDSPEGAYVVIKYDSLAKYRNAIDIIDEMDICDVPSGKYAVVKTLELAEREMLKKVKE
ncbi:MAG TPA: biopolymer transporter ExbD [Flavobacteriales bacterium]|nr:biopolymer transporter ExbD [Flavobacteriales bacterium]